MLTFKDFLTGAKLSFSDIGYQAEIIKRDCAKWLDESGGKFAWRGIHNTNDPHIKTLSKTFFIASVRNDRRPKDSPLWLHDALNKYFVSKTGVPVRSASMFCVGDQALSSNYGYRGIVFPIGDYHYTWSKKVADATHSFYLGPGVEGGLPEAGPGLNKMMDDAFKKYCEDNNIGTFHDVQDYLEDIYERGEEPEAEKRDSIWAKFATEFIHNNDLWVFDTELKTALGSNRYNQHEVMVVCDKYYIIMEDNDNYPLERTLRKLLK